MHQGQVLYGFSFPAWQSGAPLGLYLVVPLPQLRCSLMDTTMGATWFLSRGHRWLHCSARRSVELCTVQVRSDVALAEMSCALLSYCLGQFPWPSCRSPGCDGCVALLAVLDFMQHRSTLSNPVLRVDVFAKPPDDKGVCRAMSVQTSSANASRVSTMRICSMGARTPAARGDSRVLWLP